MDEITGLRFRLEEAENRCSRLMNDTKASRLDLRANGEVEADLRRALEAEAERRGIIEAEAKTREDMTEETM